MDKFKTFGLTQAPAVTVDAPLIAGRCVHLECRVVDRRPPSRYHLLVLAVRKAWTDPTCKDQRAPHGAWHLHGCPISGVGSRRYVQ